MTVQWRSDERMEMISIRLSTSAQVDTTTSLHPGSYSSPLSLENVMVTSGKFRGALSPSLVSKGVERERSEVGRLRQAGGPPGHGRSIASPGRRWQKRFLAVHRGWMDRVQLRFQGNIATMLDPRGAHRYRSSLTKN